MHKTQCDHAQDALTYQVLPDGQANVWLRGEAEEKEHESGEGTEVYYEQDEVFFKVTASVLPEAVIEEDFDFFFDQMSDREGENADDLAVSTLATAKHAELSAACSATILRGVDVELSTGEEHFSLTEVDQLNLFGKQAQIAAGATQLEYHEDGQPCKYYSAADMTLIIAAAMRYVSFQVTYCNSMYTWVRSCTKASEIAQIAWGSEIPEEYQSEVYKDYIKG